MQFYNWVNSTVNRLIIISRCYYDCPEPFTSHLTVAYLAILTDVFISLMNLIIVCRPLGPQHVTGRSFGTPSSYLYSFFHVTGEPWNSVHHAVFFFYCLRFQHLQEENITFMDKLHCSFITLFSHFPYMEQR